MGHCHNLLNRIAAQIEIEYPKRIGCEFVFERVLPGVPQRLEPDIRIDFEGQTVCVVEIGYTRPEKITAYRDIGIPDVRWYSKTGDLHSHHMKPGFSPPRALVSHSPAQPLSVTDRKIVTANDLRSALMSTIEGVINGSVSIQKAAAITALTSELHKSIDQEWQMRVYAAEHLTMNSADVIKLLES